MGKRLALILGGARSGKSSFAEALARKRGEDVLFVATAQALDDEMRARIQQHRSARNARWRMLEAPRDVAGALSSAPPARIVLLDCLTLWVSNILLADPRTAREEMMREVDELLEWYRAAQCELILVSNEVGMGLVPDNMLGRAYRDLLGAVNRRFGEQADQVFLLVAGLAVEVKSRAIRLEDL
jgi:adenosylcobinamide kinase/adenosylcobinamide-phosphate guanylyltransferase